MRLLHCREIKRCFGQAREQLAIEHPEEDERNRELMRFLANKNR